MDGILITLMFFWFVIIGIAEQNLADSQNDLDRDSEELTKKVHYIQETINKVCRERDEIRQERNVLQEEVISLKEELEYWKRPK